MSCIGICITDYLVALLLGVFSASVLNWRIIAELDSIRREYGESARKPSRPSSRRFSALRGVGRYWNYRMRKGTGGSAAMPSAQGPEAMPSDISSLMQIAVDSAQTRGVKQLRRFAAVEAVSALLYVLSYHAYGWSARGVVAMALMSVFVAVAVIDLEERIIPDGITVVGLFFGLMLGPLVYGLGILDCVLGVLLGGVLFYAIAVISRGGMGGGDIKFIAMVGAFVGWKGVLIAIFIGSLTGAVVGIGLMIFKGMGRKTPIPFGPFLVFGAVVALLYGRSIAEWYAGYAVPL